MNKLTPLRPMPTLIAVAITLIIWFVIKFLSNYLFYSHYCLGDLLFTQASCFVLN